VRLIRELLRSAGYGAVRVGTVADYQGQEEDVIIVSTVVTADVKDAGASGNVAEIDNPGARSLTLSWI
jgi:superfamily I DNA and/or RNA helicase